MFYNIIKQFSPDRAPVEAVTYENNITRSFGVTSECMLHDTYSLVIYVTFITHKNDVIMTWSNFTDPTRLRIVALDKSLRSL